MELRLLKPISRTTASYLNETTKKSQMPWFICYFCNYLFSFYIICWVAIWIYASFKISCSSMLKWSSCYESYLKYLVLNLNFFKYNNLTSLLQISMNNRNYPFIILNCFYKFFQNVKIPNKFFTKLWRKNWIFICLFKYHILLKRLW